MQNLGLKEEARRLVDALPEEATWEDLMHEIHVRQVIESGLEDIEAGRIHDIKKIYEQIDAIREIRVVDSDKLVLKIPAAYKMKKVEVLVFPVRDNDIEADRFSAFLKEPIAIENFKMPSREERNAR